MKRLDPRDDWRCRSTDLFHRRRANPLRLRCTDVPELQRQSPMLGALLLVAATLLGAVVALALSGGGR